MKPIKSFVWRVAVVVVIVALAAIATQAQAQVRDYDDVLRGFQEQNREQMRAVQEETRARNQRTLELEIQTLHMIVERLERELKDLWS